MRVFVNAAALDVPSGTDVRGAIQAHDPALGARAEAGEVLVTDARGIETPLDGVLAAGSILRVIVRAGRGRNSDADA